MTLLESIMRGWHILCQLLMAAPKSELVATCFLDGYVDFSKSEEGWNDSNPQAFSSASHHGG
jgi:hypothetical protein